jgi:asparagine synthase (glutamine-hydrolysing)
MCGITGYISSQPIDGSAMTCVMAHRGPDSWGTYAWDIADRRVFFGHRRLSIVDLSDAGRQPMMNEDESVILNYNGEIYNFEALRTQYLAGQSFTSRTDTEVILQLYLALGPDFVRVLNGDFAIAILDKRSQKLHLYRDRFGIKPLYLYNSGEVFAFSSEIKSFVAAGLKLTRSDIALQRYFVFKYVPQQETLYREVTRLEPGTYVTRDVVTGRTAQTRYWSMQKDPAVARMSYRDAAVRVRELISDAVQCRLMGDVPVGTFFSGGLDSSIVAYHVRNNPNIRHYCARKSEADLRREGTTSDHVHASRLAEQWNLKLSVIDVGDSEASPELVRLTSYYSDDLIADGSQIPSYLICRAASAQSRVILSGMGADEIFYGYAGHLLTLMALYFDRLPAAVSRNIAHALGGIASGRGALVAYRRWLRKFGRYYANPTLRYSGFTIVGDVDNALDLCTLDPENVTSIITEAFPAGRDPFESLTAFELENFLVKNLHYVDRTAMASSVEARVPYLDHRLVEFALSLPREYRLSNAGQTKRLLKTAYHDQLPAHVRRRRKAGFGMPLRSIFMNSGKMRQLLDMDFLASIPIIRVDRIPRLIANHTAGIEDNSAILYALISFQEWSRLQDSGFHGQAAMADSLPAIG